MVRSSAAEVSEIKHKAKQSRKSTTVTVSFGRGEDNKASNYANLARENGFEPAQKLKVEPMTLKAEYRSRVEKGLDLPSEHFNLFKGNKTKITRNK